jgi:5'-3' exonuclease
MRRPPAALQEYGLRPQQFVDVLALAGDASGAPLGAARPAPD